MRNSLNKKIVQIFDNKNKKLYPNFPRTILIELTNLCNSKCVFCANSKMTRTKKMMDIDLYRSILKDAFESGSREVGLYTTGEPLLYPQIVTAVEIAKKIGYEYIYLTTNGVNANINLIKELVLAGLNSIKFSINAINKKEYYYIHGIDKFDMVVKNLKSIYNLKTIIEGEFKVFVSYIATNKTEYKNEVIFNFFKQYCDEISIVNVRNQAGMMPSESKFLKCSNESDKIQAERTLPCHYVFNTAIVTCEGYLTACCTDFQNYLAYADLKKDNISEAWNNEVILNLRKQHLNGKLSNNLCYNCINSNMEVPEPLCAKYATIFTSECLEKNNAKK